MAEARQVGTAAEEIRTARVRVPPWLILNKRFPGFTVQAARPTDLLSVTGLQGLAMVRIVILFTEEQNQRLQSLARRLRTSKAKLVREGVELVLQRKAAGTRDPLLELVGQAGRVGRKDISRRHDAYLLAAERRRSR